MKIKLLIIVPIIIIILVVLGFTSRNNKPRNTSPDNESAPVLKTNITHASVFAKDLDHPSGIVILPDERMLAIEIAGRIKLIDKTGVVQYTPAAYLTQTKVAGKAGLLGITLHPDFFGNHYVYLYYTYNILRNDTQNRVVRMKFTQNRLTDERIIVDNIPGALNENGGKLKFGPDRLLYITTGDTQNPSNAQNINSLSGKILRVTENGMPAPGNPFNNLVYSLGHRDPQGLAWDNWGNLWETEQGSLDPASFDEINFIESGVNYGWPFMQYDTAEENLTPPFFKSGMPGELEANGAVFAGTSLFFSGLKEEALLEAVIDNGKVKNLLTHFKGKYGKITDILLGQNGMLYFSAGDKIFMVNPVKIEDN